jgi:hypothetical protein
MPTAVAMMTAIRLNNLRTNTIQFLAQALYEILRILLHDIHPKYFTSSNKKQTM